VQLEDLIARFAIPPEPWAEGRTIPWDDPGFSRRMLVEHLSQAHDGASRIATKIDAHVQFIERVALSKSPAKILDLGCGPGLYCHRLAEHGHTCTGIDFGPASIDYARAEASKRGLSCHFELGDIRNVSFEGEFDLVMLLYGELNLFPPDEADALLRSCLVALAPGGRLLLEVHSFDLVRGHASRSTRWSAVASGLFSDLPHLRLDQWFWLEASAHAATRYWIMDAASSEVSLFGSTMKAYTDPEYESLLARNGLKLLQQSPSLTGEEDEAGFPVLLVERA
jgi:SAM-dependent methyltransferase